VPLWIFIHGADRVDRDLSAVFRSFFAIFMAFFVIFLAFVALRLLPQTQISCFPKYHNVSESFNESVFSRILSITHHYDLVLLRFCFLKQKNRDMVEIETMI